MDIRQWVRPNILRLVPYASARSEFKGTAQIYLDANENPFPTGYNRYPDPLQRVLKERIAALKGVDPAQIFLGNGSDEAIDLIVRIFCEPRQDAILVLPPTYGMYQVAADIADVAVVTVPLEPEVFQPRVADILAAATPQTKVLFLCSPNNPTGNNFSPAALEELIHSFPGIVVVDEAYIDFSSQPSCLRWLNTCPNLIVLQTFSKAWGLAGLRLGMAFAPAATIDFFNKVKPPYNLNQLTQETALRILAEEAPALPGRVANLLAERERLEKALVGSPLVEQLYPSSANFLLARVTAPQAIYQYLVEQGIIVRSRANVQLIEGSLRITVGLPAENDALLAALQNFTA